MLPMEKKKVQESGCSKDVYFHCMASHISVFVWWNTTRKKCKQWDFNVI